MEEDSARMHGLTPRHEAGALASVYGIPFLNGQLLKAATNAGVPGMIFYGLEAIEWAWEELQKPPPRDDMTRCPYNNVGWK